MKLKPFPLLCSAQFLIATILSFTLGVFGALGPHGEVCQDPVVRKEWRTLSKNEQLAYIDAVKCLQAKPPLTPTFIAPGVGARTEDFIVTHTQQTLFVHFVGHFLPWHRFLVATYEKSLREECGLAIAQPYWDWTLDVTPPSNFANSPVFDSTYGFGGNGPFVPLPPDTPPDTIVPGRTGGGCVQDGPFIDMVVRMGPACSLSGNPRCLHRDFSPIFAATYLSKNNTDLTLAQPDYGFFARVVEGDPNFEHSGMHGGGHFGVGGNLGEIQDLCSSPSDPLFYLHHANLDRVWWSWQHQNLTARLSDISGPINILDFNNTLGGNVTLDFPLSLGLNADTVTVGDVMDIKGGTLCYGYDALY